MNRPDKGVVCLLKDTCKDTYRGFLHWLNDLFS